MSNGNSFGETNVGIGTRPTGVQVMIFNNLLLVIGGDENGALQASFYSESVGDFLSIIQSPANWKTFPVSLVVSSGTVVFPAGALGRPGAAAANNASTQAQAPFVVWSQVSLAALNVFPQLKMPTIMSSAYLGADQNGDPQWQASLILLDSSGAQLLPWGIGGTQAPADIEVVAWDSSTLLVALVAYNSTGEPGIYLGAFDTADQQPNASSESGITFGTWQAQGDVFYPVSSLAGFSPYPNYAIRSISPQVGFAWFLSSFSGSAGPFALFSFLADMSGDGGKTYALANANLLVALDPTTGLPVTGDVPMSPLFFPFGQNVTETVPTLARDPAGRLYGVAANQSSPSQTKTQLMSNVWPTMMMPGYFANEQGFVKVRSAASAWGPRPSFVFVIDGYQPQTSSGPNATGQTEAVITYPIYELVFYGSDAVLQSIFYGNVVTIQNYAVISPLTSGGETLTAVVGMMEGPPPIPLANVIGYQLENNPPTLGTLTYGITSGTNTQTMTTWSWSVGFQMESTVMFGGLGWQLEASLSGGNSGGAGSMSNVTLTNPLYASALATTNSNMVGTGVSTNGTFWGAPAALSISTYRFLDDTGAVISDATDGPGSTPQAPPAAIVMPSIGQPQTYEYTPYMVTPGDITSYTPEQINATMQKLSNNEITNYYGDIILANAYNFGVDDDPQYYLECSWTNVGGGSVSSNTVMNGLISQSGWQMNASFYTGIAWDADFSVLGMKAEGDALDGGFGDYQSTTTTTTTQGWGISLSPGWGPPTTGGPNELPADTVVEYSFRIFFLPDPPVGNPSGLAPGYWVKEALKYAPPPNAMMPFDFDLMKVDPSFGCWKIVFVVTYYELLDGTVYQYDGGLDTPRPVSARSAS